MSIQAQLDNDSICFLPKIEKLINESEVFEANQIKCRTLREMMNTITSLDKMDNLQIESFEKQLIEIFKHFNWIK
jgi:hypothetical protein